MYGLQHALCQSIKPYIKRGLIINKSALTHVRAHPWMNILHEVYLDFFWYEEQISMYRDVHYKDRTDVYHYIND